MKQKVSDQGDKISLKEIETWESDSKVILPEDYRSFLLKNNGGSPSLNCFNHKGSKYMIDKFFELDDIEDEKDVDYGKIIPKMMFPIAHDPGDNLYLISTESTDYGYIYFWHHETSEVTLISESFGSFFKSLKMYSDELEFEKYCSNNKISKAIKLIEDGLDINTKNKRNENLIEISCNYSKKDNFIDLIKLLIENGADKNFIISRVSNYKIIEYLFSIGSDINILYKNSSDCQTLLIKFSKYSDYETIEFLLNRGADPRIKDSKGNKPSDYVKKNMEIYKTDFEHHKKVYDLLLEAENKWNNN